MLNLNVRTTTHTRWDALRTLTSQIRTIILRALWRVRNHLKLTPTSEREVYYRLHLLSSLLPRYRPGTISLPFGRLHFVDVLSLRYQFLDIFLQRCYDFETERPDPLILDCGSNIGLSVVWFKQQYEQSRIIAFEADPLIAKILCANVAALRLKNVEIVEAAAWNRAGRVNFVSDGADSGRADPHGEQQLIDTVRLADFITEPIDLLKLDIEGAEYVVLQDLYETGKIELVKCLICEVHGRHEDKERLADLLKALTEWGFSFTFTHARCAPDLPGEAEPTPFSAACDGKFLLHLYAWQEP